MDRIRELLKNDPFRISILQLVASLELPDCYVAAGFLRNMVWDHLHQFPPTEMNDVDVIYFDAINPSKLNDQIIQKKLFHIAPEVIWQVKNQANMHLKNNDRPYTCSADAMTFWPEKETAIGARLLDSQELEIIAPLGVDTLFDGKLTLNSKKYETIFANRLESKKWIEKWPNLTVVL